MTRTPLLAFAALAISGSLCLAQTPPAPAASGSPTPATGSSPAPVERRPPSGGGMQPGDRSGMRPEGMPYRGSGPANDRMAAMAHHYRDSRGDFHSRGFDGPQGHIGAGFHIAPPGMWWKNPGIVQRLTLTPEQTKKMDDIFQQSRIQLIDLKANVEKQNVILEPMLSANPPDTAKTLAQIDKIAQARADLEKADARMLLGIRGVLTPDQWTRLNARGGPGSGPDTAPMGGGSGGGRGPRRPGAAPAEGENFVAPDQQLM